MVQEYNQNMKEKVFGEEPALEAVVFIEKYGSFLKDTSKKNRELVNNNEIENLDDNDFHVYNKHQDNWKGKNDFPRNDPEQNVISENFETTQPENIESTEKNQGKIVFIF